MSASMYDGLLAALAGAPSLPGALCRGRPHLFDGTDGPDGPRTQQAAALCRRCPALERCTEWAEAQPLRSLSGVIAGRLYVYVAHESQRKWPQGMEIEVKAQVTGGRPLTRDAPAGSTWPRLCASLPQGPEHFTSGRYPSQVRAHRPVSPRQPDRQTSERDTATKGPSDD